MYVPMYFKRKLIIFQWHYVWQSIKNSVYSIFIVKRYFEYNEDSDTICNVLQNNVYTYIYILLFNVLIYIFRNGVIVPITQLFLYFYR